MGAVVWQSGDARPDLGGDVQKIIGPSTPASKIFCLSVFQKQFQPTSSVGVPATLNILSSWSKTSLGKHRGEFVSFLKRSFSLSKFVDTWRPGSTDSRSSSQRKCTQRPTCPDWVRKHQSKTVLLTKDSKIESFITESSQEIGIFTWLCSLLSLGGRREDGTWRISFYLGLRRYFFILTTMIHKWSYLAGKI